MKRYGYSRQIMTFPNSTVAIHIEDGTIFDLEKLRELNPKVGSGIGSKGASLFSGANKGLDLPWAPTVGGMHPSRGPGYFRHERYGDEVDLYKYSPREPRARTHVDPSMRFTKPRDSGLTGWEKSEGSLYNNRTPSRFDKLSDRIVPVLCNWDQHPTTRLARPDWGVKSEKAGSLIKGRLQNPATTPTQKAGRVTTWNTFCGLRLGELEAAGFKSMPPFPLVDAVINDWVQEMARLDARGTASVFVTSSTIGKAYKERKAVSRQQEVSRARRPGMKRAGMFRGTNYKPLPQHWEVIWWREALEDAERLRHAFRRDKLDPRNRLRKSVMGDAKFDPDNWEPAEEWVALPSVYNLRENTRDLLAECVRDYPPFFRWESFWAQGPKDPSILRMGGPNAGKAARKWEAWKVKIEKKNKAAREEVSALWVEATKSRDSGVGRSRSDVESFEEEDCSLWWSEHGDSGNKVWWLANAAYAEAWWTCWRGEAPIGGSAGKVPTGVNYYRLPPLTVEKARAMSKGERTSWWKVWWAGAKDPRDAMDEQRWREATRAGEKAWRSTWREHYDPARDSNREEGELSRWGTP